MAIDNLEDRYIPLIDFFREWKPDDLEGVIDTSYYGSISKSEVKELAVEFHNVLWPSANYHSLTPRQREPYENLAEHVVKTFIKKR